MTHHTTANRLRPISKGCAAYMECGAPAPLLTNPAPSPTRATIANSAEPISTPSSTCAALRCKAHRAARSNSGVPYAA
jgi:hypothetical protein